MWALLLLTFVISAGVFLTDSCRDDNFRKHDAPYYAAISQNIARSGDWVTMRQSDGTVFESDHPPLTFWASALVFKCFGENVFTAVLFSILCATATCIVTFFIGMVLKNDIVGFFSGMGLLLTRLVPRVARFNTIDVPLMFFVTLAMLFLILALRKHRVFYLLFGLSVGLVVLSKGIVGVLPLGICFLAIIVQKKFKDLWNPFFLGGILIFLAMPAAGFFMKGGMSLAGAQLVFKQYMEFALPTINRPNAGARWYFIVRLFEVCCLIMPGVVLGLYFIIRDVIREKRKDLLIIPIWAVVFVGAFTVSNFRNGLYILPMYPAMAILFGIGLYEIISRNYRMVAVYLMTAFFAGNLAAPFLFPHGPVVSLQQVIFRNTYLPRAKRAVKVLYEQAPDMKFVSYEECHVGEDEFAFFFSSEYDIEFCRTPEEFEELVYSRKPVLFYITKEYFSKIDKKLHNRLKIVYAFGRRQLLVTNRLDLVPVFEAEDEE
jgi:4-amino-4-deoxy-L-arabinose transferase-like glycosyltransferase